MNDALPVARHDPIELEIVRHEILSIPNQIERNIERTAFSPLVQEYKDYAVGLVDPEGALIAQSRGSLPIFVANALGTAVREGIGVFGAETLRHGDAVMTNNPATLGQHLNNVVLHTPVREGGEADGPLLGFFAVLVHWIDVGGSAPGSSTGTSTTDVWQEGLQIPSLKLLDRGVRVEGMLRLLAANTRFPRLLLGDLEAQLGGCLMGRDLVLDIVRRRGATTLRAATEAMRRQAAAAAGGVIRAMPAGTYHAESFLDGEGGGPVPVKVAVHSDGERLTVDLSGLGAQMPGPSNAGRNGGAVAAARIAAKYLLTPEEPVNSGDFDRLDVVAPDGTFLTARADAPIGGSGNTIPTVVDTILRALGEALPDRARAAHHGTYGVHTLFGRLPESGALFTNLDTATGGWGASATEDGAFPLRSNAHGDVPDIPVEMQEALYPFRLEGKALRPDSGGPGRRRGGLGVEKLYEVLAPAKVSLKFERGGCPPWGLAGGHAAATCFVEIRRATDGSVLRAWKGIYELHPGDRLRIVSGGGGGYGPPEAREPERVRDDVVQGYVTVGQAREAYAVILCDDLSVDEEATAALRAERQGGDAE
ncbi:hydantoinase B/oxoprolinase family protein [Muricoccus radiodurans]|uniref:hydantoinase B/oxoprolinase family protein n=1 Tax=Muricoccus radiodurans TaxID=2231721 RepID=UPI003CF202F2